MKQAAKQSCIHMPYRQLLQESCETACSKMTATLNLHHGIYLQAPMLFSTTVFENISYGFPEATQEDVARAAHAANAHEFIWRLPQGYQTSVTNTSLSGGQQQRIALARALFRNPRLLVRSNSPAQQQHCRLLAGGTAELYLESRQNFCRSASLLYLLCISRSHATGFG